MALYNNFQDMIGDMNNELVALRALAEVCCE